MKHVLVLFVSLVTGLASFAQFSLGVQATGNIASAHVQLQEADGMSKKMKLLPGGGLVAQYNFGNQLAVRTGVGYLQNGATVTTKGIDPQNIELGTITVTAKTNLHYAQVPLNVLYYITTGDLKLYVGLGAFASYGFSGTTNFSGTYIKPDGQPQTVNEKQDAFKKESDGGAGFKRFDWGASAIAGVQFANNLFVQAGYQYSISDIDPNKESKYNNRSAQLSIGYFFLAKK